MTMILVTTTKSFITTLALAMLLSLSAAMPSDVHYAVEFSYGTPIEKSSPLDEVYDIAGYNCLIPEILKKAELDRPLILTPLELEVQKREAIDLIVKFNEYWHKKISYVSKHHGYWDYTLMFNKSLHQLHLETIQAVNSNNQKAEQFKSLVASYMLFQVDGKHVESDFELINLESGLKYVTQTIGGGDECDLTGSPRSTIIKYMCNPDANIPILSKIEEWRTCTYMATLESDWFCSNNSNIWSQETLNEEALVKCVLHDDLVQNDEWEFAPPLNLSKFKYSPLSMGIFIGNSREKNGMNILLLNKEFNLRDSTLDKDGRNHSWDSFLQIIGTGFSKLIKSGQLNAPSGLFPVSASDKLSYVLPMYDMNRMLIGSVLIEQDEGLIFAYMTNEISVDFDKGNWNFYSQADISNNEVI